MFKLKIHLAAFPNLNGQKCVSKNFKVYFLIAKSTEDQNITSERQILSTTLLISVEIQNVPDS